MGNKVICVELNDEQQKRYEEWLSHIKALYGEYGILIWTITPTGIFNGLKVYSKIANVELDLTDLTDI